MLGAEKRISEGGLPVQLRALTVRIPEDQAKALEFAALLDGCSVADELRDAIARHLAARRADPDYQERLDHSIAQNRT